VLLENGLISQAQYAALQVKGAQEKKTDPEANTNSRFEYWHFIIDLHTAVLGHITCKTTMGKVIRVKPHLTIEEIDERLKNLHDFWRIRRWMVIRHALVDPAPAKAIALRLGLSVFTVRDLIEAYNRHGPEVLETAGKGQRQRAYLSVDRARLFGLLS
jgi:hypothetical protein